MTALPWGLLPDSATVDASGALVVAGCSVADLVGDCTAAMTLQELKRCVWDVTKELRDQGAISNDESVAIRRCVKEVSP